MALVLDTGVLYAALDAGDSDHGACASLLAGTDEQLIIPEPVLVELDYWVRKFAAADAWLAFCEDVAAGAYALVALGPRLLERSAQAQARFADLPLNLVDASVLVVCESLGETKVATLDRRHFTVLRTADGESLHILPE